MRPSAPTTVVWILGLIFGLLGIISKYLVVVSPLTENSTPLIIIGFALLAVGTSFRNV